MTIRFDVVTLGRSSVDLYGEQVGGRLEDMGSFAKYVGGCPANIAIGTARLGLRSALITRVGDEAMGRFIREQLARDGVDTSGVVTDPERLTALVILGIRDQHSFPLIFYRENCADAAMQPDDVDPAMIRDARALLVTGTHFSRPNLDATSRHAMALARLHGRRIVLDIDYRPVLWGIGGHDSGEQRFVAADSVSAHLQSILPECDVVVGTEEEIHIAGGSTDTLSALRRVRAVAPQALIVLKRGPMGCVLFDGPIPASVEDGITGQGFPIEVFNVLGAGDSFLSGFLRGYLRDQPLADCARFANACGAITVSRHGCAPSGPSWAELSAFLREGSPTRRLREDARLEQLHWSTNRRRPAGQVLAFAFDHRAQLEAEVTKRGMALERIGRFKELALDAALAATCSRGDGGILVDGRLGQDALYRAAGRGLWIGRPIELPGAVPLAFEGGDDLGSTLKEWPLDHCVKCLVRWHPDDDPALVAEQERRLLQLFTACRKSGHELLLEVIASASGRTVGTDTVPAVMARCYDLGIHPDWWKLEAPADRAGWQAIQELVASRDRFCRGVLLLGLDAPLDRLTESFRLAAGFPVCQGFAVGRSIFGQPFRDWLDGRLDDAAATAAMAERYGGLLRAWDRARGETA
ncbi:bifunctional 5-dehydro-2-deoxygluconokinase/5-dehydro-2-deoxyphosphogluconate aldolase [Geminicoccus harenae]|uniref:bifunctional 5-dehydro-2-deoxygluconokinase/5-dehydro-2- deoxyphosphogluconate aldolase n=1 Tax=Geminicoccus harenae TaxID=2498453 RepID=UPI00168A9A7A|nr:5-dehydro-2-deoxygluconokinase [Geminicoccus harenae]